MANLNGAWSETALIAVVKQAGTAVEFQAITETVDIDIGAKDFDAIATLGGGRVIKFTPQEPTTITMEMYCPDAGTATGAGVGAFDLFNTVDSSQPVVIPVDRTRTKYRVAILWTDAASITAEGQVVTPTNSALRVVASDGYFTSVKPSYTDGLLKFTVVYKVAPFDTAGAANVKVESVSGLTTATLSALASYVSTIKW